MEPVFEITGKRIFSERPPSNFRHLRWRGVPHEAYFFLREAVCVVHEIGEAAFEERGSPPCFFGRNREFFVAASEVSGRVRREAVFGFGVN